MEPADNWQAFRMRLFLEGHRLDYIDNLSVVEIARIMAYLQAKSKAEEKARRTSKQGRRH